MNFLGFHFRVRRWVLDLFEYPSRDDRDIERWVDSLTPDEQNMLVARLLIFSVWGLSGRGMRAYIKKMRREGVIRETPGKN
jgi:hypothetical protein